MNPRPGLPSAQELERLDPETFLWHAYDPKARTELFSTAVFAPKGLILVDPIPLPRDPLTELLTAHEQPFAGVIVTNANHWRAAIWFARMLSAPVFVHPETAAEGDAPDIRRVQPDQELFDFLRVVDLAGGAPGEIALFAATTSSLIVGDALINFEPYGFTLLPAKYCRDQKQLRQSLRQILPLAPERICFAHGLPILKNATGRLEALLRDAN